jgi:serine/threonine-protein kinase
MKPAGVILVAVITSFATSVGVLYAAHRWGHLMGAQEEKVAVPDLMGKTEGDAKTNLEAVGLRLVIDGREPSSDAKDGTVIRQVPKAGERLAKNQPVSLTFALAAPKVPDVVGKKVEEATKLLEEAGYKVKVGDAVASDKHEAGLVAAQEPASDSTLKPKETVTLQPSSGKGEIEVPKLVGLGLIAAKKEAEKLKLKVTVQYVALAETATGVVLRQNPAAGEKVAADAEITVVVNQ